VASALLTACVVLLFSLLASEPLAMESAVEAALARAPELLARAKVEEAAGARADEAFSSYLPRVNVDVSYLAKSPKNELPIDLPPIPNVPPVGDVDDIHHFQAGVSFGYRIFDLSRGPFIDAAEARAEAEKHESADLRSKLAFEVRATYLAALFARDTQRIAAESLEVAREEERRAEVAAEVGTGSSLVLAQARVRVATLEAQKTKAENELERHMSRLASLAGRRLELTGDLVTLGGPLPELAIAEHPGLQKIGANRRAAELMDSAETRAFLPTLSARGSIELVYPRALSLEIGPVYQLAALISWPAFDGLQHWSAAEVHRATAESLGELARGTEARIERELIDLSARAKTARAELASAERTLEETQLYLRVATAAVEAGTGTDLDVHNAELGIDQARIAVQRARFELALIRAQTLMTYGRGSEG
jgi:outer membrane protein